MRRQLLFPALLLMTLPVFAESVTVHLDFGESARAALVRGDLQGVYVFLGEHSALTKESTVVFNAAPGKTKVSATLQTAGGYYVVEPKEIDVDVKAGTEVTVPSHSLFVDGTLFLHGKPLRGAVCFAPSEASLDTSRLCASSDGEGRFKVPLWHPGPYDVQVVWRDRGQQTTVPRVEFRDDRMRFDLPEGAIAGRVVDRSGRGIAHAEVRALLAGSGRRDVRALAVADAGGNFSIEGLTGGTWRIWVGQLEPIDVVVATGGRTEGVLLRVASPR